jgi:DNA-binding HxlR family transcriptional regulator
VPAAAGRPEASDAAEGREASATPGSREASETAGANGVCPHFHAAVELVGKRWNGAILAALGEGPMRFAELGRAVTGLSDRLLSQRLRELEGEGLVIRSVEPGSPVRVSYELTAKGSDLKPALAELRTWARRWNE